MIISALPVIGSRAASALREKDAEAVEEGQAPGAGDVGVGGIEIGRPPTAFGATAGLSVPAIRPRSDTILWTIPAGLLDLARDPAMGLTRPDGSPHSTASVAVLAWRTAARLPVPPE